MIKFKEILDKSSKKYQCPGCGKKTFVRFIEIETGNLLNQTYGRCDREQQCGYFKKPQNSNFTYTKKYFEPITKKTDYIPIEKLDYYCNNDISKCDFYVFLKSNFPYEKVNKAMIDYFVSCKDKNVIFWQIDNLEKIRTGKIMSYNSLTCKRSGYIDWIHDKGYNIKQCLFGLELINHNKNKQIAIVESEKTAIICSIVMPDFIWMATGAMHQLKQENLFALKNREIFLFPDLGVFHFWNLLAQKLNNFGFNIKCSDIIENESKLKKGDDLADLILKDISKWI